MSKHFLVKIQLSNYRIKSNLVNPGISVNNNKNSKTDFSGLIKKY